MKEDYCPVCNIIQINGKNCNGCNSKLITRPVCNYCGRELWWAIPDYCPGCGRTTFEAMNTFPLNTNKK